METKSGNVLWNSKTCVQSRRGIKYVSSDKELCVVRRKWSAIWDTAIDFWRLRETEKMACAVEEGQQI